MKAFILVMLLSFNSHAKKCSSHKSGLQKLTDFIEEVKGKPLNKKDLDLRKK